MAERLMGVETEYAASAVNPWGDTYDPAAMVSRMMQLGRDTLVQLPDVGGGLYLGNGSRFYIDYGNHPELATPECTNPWDVVRYILAGERIIADLASRTGRDLNAEVLLFKSNVDYSGMWATWGCHESYMHCASPHLLSDQIIPHLVTRIIYTGAGGFNSQSGGLEFTLSPRVAHLSSVVSNNSTSDRGIFHTKDESLTKRGFHRLHLICGESLCSETSMLLKVGTTALIVAMAEAGVHPGAGVGLRSPLQAMQTISKDLTCSALVETVQGRGLSAIEIQYHYLSLAERHIDAPWMPPWAEEVCRLWRETLNRLLDAPESVATTLDWAIKHALYSSHADSRGVTWDSLPFWTRMITEARFLFAENGVTIESVLDRRNRDVTALKWLTQMMEEEGFRLDDFESVFNLRQELFEIDTRFGQLGGSGIFEGLDRAGVLEHHVRGVDDISPAISSPPAAGRARIRGEAIRRLAGQNGDYVCDWEGILNAKTRRMLDLSEPFETVERWIEYEQVVSAGTPAFAALVARIQQRNSPVF